ncbi:MAG: hypothetical protein ACUX7D_00570 [Candidatus Methanodesulfokora washburnensis]|jgi:hypothetical protein
MARTFKEIEIEGKRAYVLFDTRSIRSYVRSELASGIRWKTTPFRVGLGGRIYEIDEACILNCSIEGLPFDIEAHPVEELGFDERGRRIDAIIGALAMEKWALIPDPRTGGIDLTALRKREFTEYFISS